MCSGPSRRAADGVFIGGCHLNECNYVTHGNYHTFAMVPASQEAPGAYRAGPGGRLECGSCPAAEANLFTESVNDFVKTIKELGPLGKSEGIDAETLKFRLDSVTKLIPYIRLVERERLRLPPMYREGRVLTSSSRARSLSACSRRLSPTSSLSRRSSPFCGRSRCPQPR